MQNDDPPLQPVPTAAESHITLAPLHIHPRAQSPEPKRKTRRKNQKIRTRRSTTHLVLQPQEARPPALDERVVGSDDGDDVDALGFELVDLLQERRQVVHVARRLRICAAIQFGRP